MAYDVVRPDEFEWVVPGHPDGPVLALATPVELRFAQVWTFRDGEPARMVLYADADKGRRAAS